MIEGSHHGDLDPVPLLFLSIHLWRDQVSYHHNVEVDLWEQIAKLLEANDAVLTILDWSLLLQQQDGV